MVTGRGIDLDLAMDAGGAFAFAGYASGIAAVISTPAYIDSALTWAHAQLTLMLDDWIDQVARTRPRELQHVYEWPSRYHNYAETVGNPVARLWKHTLSGRGRNKVASFRFMASKRPSPVNPDLLKADNGRKVKEGVHIFVWKAPAMEYNYDITVEPKLAQYLAYVFRDPMSNQGIDESQQVREYKDGRKLAFSAGPVTFQAGGSVTHLKFTSLYQYWWASIAENEFDAKIRPRLEHDMVDKTELAAVIRMGNKRSTKFGGITAQASKDTADWRAAERLAIADLKSKQGAYIEQARARRLQIYGDAGWDR